jgi:hypothetical protein
MKFQCKINNSDPKVALGLEIWIDQQQVYNSNHVDSEQNIVYELDESQDQHQLKFVLKNKKPEHTVIDENQKIIKDALINITHVEFDGINVDQLMYQYAEYKHHQNTNFGSSITEEFYGTIGCNGIVTLDFTTPVYLWLLENM